MNKQITKTKSLLVVVAVMLVAFASNLSLATHPEECSEDGIMPYSGFSPEAEQVAEEAAAVPSVVEEVQAGIYGELCFPDDYATDPYPPEDLCPPYVPPTDTYTDTDTYFGPGTRTDTFYMPLPGGPIVPITHTWTEFGTFTYSYTGIETHWGMTADTAMENEEEYDTENGLETAVETYYPAE